MGRPADVSEGLARGIVVTGVSQETTSSRGVKYRQARSTRTRERMIAAVLAHAGAGNYRVSAHQVCQYAQVGPQSIKDHFGSLGLLCRVVAREHWRMVPLPVGLAVLCAVRDRDRKALAWALLVGAPRDV